jgi:hypothetical protein
MALSDKLWEVGQDWADKDAAASMLEEAKSAYLSQMMAKLGDIPVSHAEREVKASDEWMEYITKMVEARKEANLAKLKVDFIRMKSGEQQSKEATARAEMRL